MVVVGPSPTAPQDSRRSFKARFQLSLFPRQPACTSSIFSLAGTSISLPDDLLREIIKNLAPIDILSASITSRHMRELLIPVLYETVHLRSSRSCESGLRMLSTRQHLCSRIHKLAVRPNYYLAWPTRDKLLSDDWVAKMITALAKSLTNLRAFDWDGLEMPPNRLWRTLRNSCPELKRIYSNVGTRPLDPESELFKFRDLTNFSMSIIFLHMKISPMQLWDMILNRCPNLRELALCSFSPSYRLFNINRVTEGRWPALSSLTVGSFGYDNEFNITGLPAAAFAEFLAAHPTLTFLRLAWNFKYWISPKTMVDLSFPPKLDSFAGVVQQLPRGGCSTLTSLDLTCEPLYSSRAPTVCTALRALPALTKLELWVHLPKPRAGHEEFFHDLWSSTPGLEDLHFMCTTAFGKKPLTELARALRLLPYLHTFALTKGYCYDDENMKSSALRIFTTLMQRPCAVATQTGQVQSKDSTPMESVSLRLNQLSIRWARPTYRNHLKQEGVYRRIFGPLSPCDRYDHERGMECYGMMVDAWERGLHPVGGAFERCYRFPLPFPQATPEVERRKKDSSID
ncbi:F-box domain-containing protein [Mycena sanguinolenta]|uniref:F-box domain-containing protein n=1 Tax=Mycena sanguinolenta TaxID=230812 RepID=A0A8H7CK72_9AGAR|nr:F-box domain-containing protein [Mycena sanguinolenta]